ncbi:MAG: GNAT family N-acetyltransferase [Chloroflexota bacterium]
MDEQLIERELTTWSLEMLSPDAHRRGSQPTDVPLLVRAEVACPELNRFLYTAVGGGWYWIDRLGWTRSEWAAYLETAETWVAYLRGTPVGFFELLPERDGSVEIVFFGLLEWGIGRGLGGWMLSQAIDRGWALGARRVWLHTCSLDGPHALANYQARGFRVFDTVVEQKLLPAESPGPWPGWR